MRSFALEPVALEATVEECVRLVAPSALSRHIKITRSMEHCAGDYVLADRQRLVQALLNLLSNAVKYSGNEAHISVEAVREHVDAVGIGGSGRGEACPRAISSGLAVRDTGPGFTDDEKARLFQPFERLGAERTTVPGTGLGLALTRKLVQGMHGTIGVESEHGVGSTFWIRLTRSPVAASKPRVRRKPPVPIPVVACERTVLYVEDNLATIGLMEEVFSMRPQIHLLTAMQGGLTLELAREHQPDLIVLDLHLPDIQGDEVLAQLRADPRTAGIPVVMCSADATERRRKQLHRRGRSRILDETRESATLPAHARRGAQQRPGHPRLSVRSVPPAFEVLSDAAAGEPLAAERTYGRPLPFPGCSAALCDRQLRRVDRRCRVAWVDRRDQLDNAERELAGRPVPDEPASRQRRRQCSSARETCARRLVISGSQLQ